MARPQGFRIDRQAWDDALRSSGMTLTTIARRALMPRGTLSHLVNGDRGASGVTVRQLAHALGVDPATIFPTFGKGDPLTLDEVNHHLQACRLCTDKARHLVAIGKLAKVPGAGRILIPRDELRRFVASEVAR